MTTTFDVFRVNRDFEDLGIEVSLDKFKLPENNKKIKFIKNGLHHIILITKDNEIYVYGDNFCNQLGLPEEIKFIKEFTKINKYFGNIKYLECADYFTIILNDNNDIYATGRNFYNLSNLPEKIQEFTKIEHSIKENISFIRCGYFRFMFLITENNNLYGIGSNASGQLGMGHFNKVCEFTKVENLNLKIKDIRTCYNYSILLDKFGDVYFTGSLYELTLNFSSVIINEEKIYNFTKIELPFKVKEITSSEHFIFFIDYNNNQQLYSVGYNHYGQLGLQRNPNSIKRITKIEGIQNVRKLFKIFGEHTIILCNDNELYGCGNNNEGQLGIESDNCKKRDEYGGLVYLDEFTKLDYFNSKRKFVEVLLMFDKTFIVESDYEMNSVVEKEEDIKMKMLKSCQNEKLSDVIVKTT